MSAENTLLRACCGSSLPKMLCQSTKIRMTTISCARGRKSVTILGDRVGSSGVKSGTLTEFLPRSAVKVLAMR